MTNEIQLTEEEKAWVMSPECPDPRLAQNLKLLTNQCRPYWAAGRAAPAPFMNNLLGGVRRLRRLMAEAKGETIEYKNSLGIVTDDDDPLKNRTLVTVYGDVKLGKSTDVAKAFARTMRGRDGQMKRGCLFILSDETVIAPYADWYARNEEYAQSQGYLDPRIPESQGGLGKVVIPELQADGITPADNWGMLSEYLQTHAISIGMGWSEYAGVVIDEYGTIMDRIYQQMMRLANDPNSPHFKTDKGKSDGYGPPREILNYIRWITALSLKRTEEVDGVRRVVPPTFMCLVGHPNNPAPDGMTKGTIKMPTVKGSMVMSAASHALLRYFKEPVSVAGNIGAVDPNQPPPEPDLEEGEVLEKDGTVRRIQVQPSRYWDCGIRDYGSARETFPMDLLRLMRETGFMTT